MSNYSSHQPYSPPQGPPPSAAPPAKKNCYKKGLGFVPNTISKTDQDPIALLLKAAPTMTKGQFTSTTHPEALYESEATIPLFDLELLATAEGEQRREMIESFGLALCQVGFLGLKVDNFSSLINSVYREMEKYFHQPFDAKLLNWKKEDGDNRGFSYRGCETGPKAPRPDFKESFFVTHDFSEWPQNQPTFSRAISEFYSVLTEVNKYLMVFLMEYLGNPEEGESEGNHLLRLAYYPPFKAGDDPEGIWSAAHKDKYVLSVLTKGTVPGLQYYSRKGLWEPVVVPEGYLIINTGFLLQHKTCGMIQARWHRVVNPGGKYTRLERLSSVFYGSWPDDFSLQPFTNCVERVTSGMSPERKREFVKKYPEMTVQEKLNLRTLYPV